MRRRVAICKFNPADYSRWEGQEGVGLQGETPPALSRRMAAAFIRCRHFYSSGMCGSVDSALSKIPSNSSSDESFCSYLKQFATLENQVHAEQTSCFLRL